MYEVNVYGGGKGVIYIIVNAAQIISREGNQNQNGWGTFP